MGYEIWDLESGNLVADFDDRTDALASLRELIEDNGAEVVGRLSLEYVSDEGRSTDEE